MDHQKAYSRYTATADGPLTVLALLMIPLIAVPLIFDLSPRAEDVVLAADWLIWAIFALDYAIRLYLAPQRGRFVRTHVPDLAIVIIPFLRPLRLLRSARVLRLLRLGRLAAFATRGGRDLGRIFGRRGVSFVLVSIVALVFVSAAVVMEMERGAPGSNIASYPDSLWWASTTITTVGYGDRFPTTPGGRGVAVLLMLSGIALFGVLTASVAAFFVEEANEENAEGGSLQAIEARLAAIEAKLDSGGSEAP